MPDISMTQADANVALIASGYDAFARGDIPAVLAIFDKNIHWQIPGRSPLARDVRGHGAVHGFFKQLAESSNGTLRVSVDDILAKGDRVVALVTVSARRGERTWSSPSVHVWTLRNNRVVEMREYLGDEHGADEFWSA